jgi:peptidoglycan/LPS O-acetylase OafA/YrhL
MSVTRVRRLFPLYIVVFVGFLGYSTQPRRQEAELDKEAGASVQTLRA